MITSTSSPAATVNSLNSAFPLKSYSARAGGLCSILLSGSSSESDAVLVVATSVSRCSVHAADVLIPASNSDCGRWEVTLEAEGNLEDRGRVAMGDDCSGMDPEGIDIEFLDERRADQC